MCTQPLDIGLEAYARFIPTNLGDPGHFPGTQALERAYLDWILKQLHAPQGAEALLVSGGTEANILATVVARERWQDDRSGRRDVRPNIVASEEAHFSFAKAALLTDVELRTVPSDGQHRADPARMADAIDDNTCMLVGIAGTTEFGAIDPIEGLAGVAASCGIPLHVDAAFGGFTLMHMETAGYDRPDWDFDVPGVTSITLDPHKMGAAAIPAGVLAIQDGSRLGQISTATPYVTTERQASILGTRPGAAAAAAYAVAAHLGHEGYARIVDRCLTDTRWFRQELEQRGMESSGGPLNVILVHTDHPHQLQETLSHSGWRVNVVPSKSAIRIVIMPHVSRQHLVRFVQDLDQVMARESSTRSGTTVRNGEAETTDAASEGTLSPASTTVTASHRVSESTGRCELPADGQNQMDPTPERP